MEAVVAALTLEVVVRSAVVLPPGFVPVVLCPDVAAEEDSCVEEAVSVLVGGAALLSMGRGGRVLRANVVSRTAIVSITAAAAHAAMYALCRYPSGFTVYFFS